MGERESSTGVLTIAAVVGILAVLAMLVCAGVGLWLLRLGAAAQARAAADFNLTPVPAPVAPVIVETAPEVPAAITSAPHDQSLASGEVIVRITSVSRGKVPFKTTPGDAETNDEHLLIRLSVANTSQSSTVDFLAWNQPSDQIGPYATLQDDGGNTYSRIDFSLGSKVLGLEPEQTIEPGQAIEAALVFELPRETAKELRLTLPCKAIGTEGELRFDIPAGAIATPTAPPSH